MKIAIFISALDDGGAARIVSNITRHLSSQYDVDIILNNSDKVSFPYKGRIVSLDIPNANNRESIIYQIRAFFRRVKKLKNLKIQNEYACCISYMDSANLVNILTAVKGCKTIINVVNNMSASAKYNWKYRYIVNPVIKLFYNKSDLILALSDDVKNDLIANYKLVEDKVKVSYCSIILDDIDKLISSYYDEIDSEWFDKNNTIITAGRLTKQKGQWHLIRAFSRVLQFVPSAKLCIFGNGELEEYLKKLIKGYGIEKNVKLYGFNNMLDAYISHSAIFCFPSLYEGFGTALQEALACDVACVSTDYDSGAREQLAPERKTSIKGCYKGKYGIVTEKCSERMPSFDEELERQEIILADALVEMLKNEKARNYYAKMARTRSKEYDIEKIVNLWMRDVNECVGNK